MGHICCEFDLHLRNGAIRKKLNWPHTGVDRKSYTITESGSFILKFMMFSKKFFFLFYIWYTLLYLIDIPSVLSNKIFIGHLSKLCWHTQAFFHIGVHKEKWKCLLQIRTEFTHMTDHMDDQLSLIL